MYITWMWNIFQCILGHQTTAFDKASVKTSRAFLPRQAADWTADTALIRTSDSPLKNDHVHWSEAKFHEVSMPSAIVGITRPLHHACWVSCCGNHAYWCLNKLDLPVADRSIRGPPEYACLFACKWVVLAMDLPGCYSRRMYEEWRGLEVLTRRLSKMEGLWGFDKAP